MASNNAVFNGVSEGFRDMLADFAPVSEWVEWVESQKPPKNYPVYIHHLPHRCAGAYASQTCPRTTNNSQVMGLLSLGTPLPWDECKEYADHVRHHGITQLLHIWDRLKSRSGDKLLWGDEVRRDRLL